MGPSNVQQNNVLDMIPEQVKQKQCSGYGPHTNQPTEVFRIWYPKSHKQTMCRIWPPTSLIKNHVQDMVPNVQNKQNNAQDMGATKV